MAFRFSRPLSVAVVGNLLLFGAIIRLSVLIAVMGGPDVREKANLPIFVGVLFLSAIVPGACGYFILEGVNWARIALFAVWGSGTAILMVVDPGVESVVRLILFVLFAPLLCTRRARQFFSGKRIHRSSSVQTEAVQANLREKHGPAHRKPTLPY